MSVPRISYLFPSLRTTERRHHRSQFWKLQCADHADICVEAFNVWGFG